jgi:small subunit ribosomal protein S21
LGFRICPEGGCLYMVKVKKMPGDSDDTLIRKFSRKVMTEGILQEAKRREFYLKPSLAKKMKQEESRRNKKKLWQ